MTKNETYKVGDRITYKAGGKVSRLEGMAGKIVKATITRVRKIDGEQMLSVDPDYRQKPNAKFTMGAAITDSQVIEKFT